MDVTVHVPTSLREFSAGQPRVTLGMSETTTLQDVLGCLHRTNPGVVERVLDEQGTVRPHVNLFVNGENVRLGQGLQTEVEANAEVWIIPAVSGG